MLHSKDASVQNFQFKLINFGMKIKLYTRTQVKTSKRDNMTVAAHTRTWQSYCSQDHLLVSDGVLFSNEVTTREWSTVND